MHWMKTTQKKSLFFLFAVRSAFRYCLALLKLKLNCLHILQKPTFVLNFIWLHNIWIFVGCYFHLQYHWKYDERSINIAQQTIFIFVFVKIKPLSEQSQTPFESMKMFVPLWISAALIHSSQNYLLSIWGICYDSG